MNIQRHTNIGEIISVSSKYSIKTIKLGKNMMERGVFFRAQTGLTAGVRLICTIHTVFDVVTDKGVRDALPRITAELVWRACPARCRGQIRQSHHMCRSLSKANH